MTQFLNKLTKLVDVKSIVTLALTGVFSYLQIKNIIQGEQFLTIFTVIIQFYFGTQSVKNTQNTYKEDANIKREDDTPNK